MSIIGIMPARYASTRLPGKPLVDICGKPLIQRVWENLCTSTMLKRIIIATDDKRIVDLCENIGAEYILTPENLVSGSDRVMWAYNNLKEDSEIIVNMQGDEPLLTGELIDNLLEKFTKSKSDVGTLVKKITSKEELLNPSVVKVAVRKDSTAMYFSRHPIPFVRDIDFDDWMKKNDFYKHIGIYAYRKDALIRFSSLPVSDTEKTEQLEQLRLLEDGASYLCVETDIELIGVDTPEDLEKVCSILNKK